MSDSIKIDRERFRTLAHKTAVGVQLDPDSVAKIDSVATEHDAVGVGSFTGVYGQPPCTWTLAGLPRIGEPTPQDMYEKRLAFGLEFDAVLDRQLGKTKQPFYTLELVD